MTASDSNDVVCPRCQAQPGEPCLKPDGRPAPGPHKARREAIAAELDAMRRRAENDAPDRITEPRWRRLFVACRIELEQRGDWTALAREQLEAMVRKMAAAEEAATKAERDPVVRGSTGQAVANPLFAIWVRLDSEANRLAKTLKLTPDTRGAAAPRGDDGAELDGDTGEVGDELDELDELAEVRKRRVAGGKRSR